MFEKTENNNKVEIPDSVLQCFNRINVEIAEDYISPEGGDASCKKIAEEIARKLLTEGKRPFIMEVAKFVNKNSGAVEESMFPLKYEDKEVSWGTHIVCCCDKLVFDPILEKPVSIDDYTKNVFGEDIEMRVAVSEEKMKDYIK
ncbi:MAG: hypothetical protein KAS78_04640 [Candidatus Pacebacteria bacterium]|nr:hypothetical protein [Candidatus Paceibacterota bacterium]